MLAPTHGATTTRAASASAPRRPQDAAVQRRTGPSTRGTPTMGTRRMASLRVRAASPMVAPRSAADRRSRRSQHRSPAQATRGTNRAYRLSDMRTTSLIHTIGCSATRPAAMRPTRSPARRRANNPDTTMVAMPRVEARARSASKSSTPGQGEDGQERGVQRRVEGRGLAAALLVELGGLEPVAVGVLDGLLPVDRGVGDDDAVAVGGEVAHQRGRQVGARRLAALGRGDQRHGCGRRSPGGRWPPG